MEDNSVGSVSIYSDAAFSLGSSIDIKFDNIQEFVDTDLAHSPNLEEDELDKIMMEFTHDQILSPSKVPPSEFYASDSNSSQESDDNDAGSKTNLPDIPRGHVRRLAARFEQIAQQPQEPPRSPKRRRETTTTTSSTSTSKTSIIHNKLQEGRVIWISFDLETGGPSCGIIQLSAVFYDSKHQQLGQYDSYCKPPRTAKFLPQACECHGIDSHNHEKLRNAPAVEKAWIDFCSELKNIFHKQSSNLNTDSSELAGVLVAWNGKSSDINWILKLVYSSTNCDLPNEMSYFMGAVQF